VSPPANFAAMQPLMDQWADQYGLPREVVYGLVWQESGFNPNAVGDNGLAYGLTQVHAATAQGVGFTGDPSALFDPDTNLQYGLAYLQQKVATYGDIATALSAYNAGHAITGNASYVQSILGYAAYFAQQEGVSDGTTADDGSGDDASGGSSVTILLLAAAAAGVFWWSQGG
jgi:soluble lytic murein transglycosylase-like protein